MIERELRRRCRRLLNELDIRPPLDVATLCWRVGERRGKPIRLVSHPIPIPGPFGAWITTKRADYILYQQETTKAHQDHIILHELGHLLAGHRSDEQDGVLTGQLYPPGAGLTPDVVRRALRRTSYDTAEEREAETVATIILEWASVLNRVAFQPPDEATVVRRLDEALTDHRIGWL
ncbi:hypothetical protein IU500_22130 [Nocardia terpenica]|uniref:hypothetical protein n=1 Tax=Nocardia terpenica TaxID=455432 RepID=UPI001895BDE5|nr:hypothetical protein [Nocardia terpenica]MBF6064638.1 hypothetical protein [Nocardia terpenica]MBF6106738.1 hypothetical protein [Nocardia terpenica]MBF6114606.1 hypothetical protein [Nocardia terpenica]MBF6121308.1 hypothetical protein [Nocardia terpenica]MBF6153723.1 hypothetical protein [Nocardia terpenica]